MVIMKKEDIVKVLDTIKKKEDKISFLEETIKKLKNKNLIEELEELIESIKSPDISNVVKEEKFSEVKLSLPKERKEENLEDAIAKEEPKIKETGEEKKYKPVVYEARRQLYDDSRIRKPEEIFFDGLKSRLDKAGLLPNDMIFNDKNVKDIRIYMQNMNLPDDKVEKYLDKIIDLKHELYKAAKGKDIGIFNQEYEVE